MDTVNKKDGAKAPFFILISIWSVACAYSGEWIFSSFKAQRRARSLSYVTRVGTQKDGKSRRPDIRKQLVRYLYPLPLMM
ncbi:hypothetical protein GZ78_04260 [Endozoicomonas numazuensis]|uniref:Uncharacterized protein n=1 Tax=Endozoicomonas numazuensis TaxID=1137799 RepID=A0A081NL91_9GAMM|nr:hypothetical protein GZ78_04260 [Endozoicomonas numazuensis]